MMTLRAAWLLPVIRNSRRERYFESWITS